MSPASQVYPECTALYYDLLSIPTIITIFLRRLNKKHVNEKQINNTYDGFRSMILDLERYHELLLLKANLSGEFDDRKPKEIADWSVDLHVHLTSPDT